MATVNPIPDGYGRLTPALIIDGAADAIRFYCDILGGRERMRMDGPGGKVGHAELEFGDSVLMVADEFPDMGYRGPRAHGGTSVTLNIYVSDVDAVFEQAISAGAREVRPVQDQFYGDRTGQFEDPWGHRWNVATHVEDVPEEELARRAQEMMAQG